VLLSGALSEACCLVDCLCLASAKSDLRREELSPASWFLVSCFLECSEDSAWLAQFPELGWSVWFPEWGWSEWSPESFRVPELQCLGSD
jgi:hypothetical protein